MSNNDYTDPRWQKLRLHAMDRDGWICVSCGDGKSTLHVHHKRYCGKIWDSPLDDLQTLCGSCHASLGVHKKAGLWFERVGNVDRRFVAMATWNLALSDIAKDTTVLALQNCPECAHQQFIFEKEQGLIRCVGCGWSIRIDRHFFLHAPAVVIDLDRQRQLDEERQEEEQVKAAMGQLKAWAKKCRTLEVADEDIWRAVFPEEGVPLGYEFDLAGMLAVDVLATDEIQRLRAYLTSGMSFQDVVFEIAGISEEGRKILAKSGY